MFFVFVCLFVCLFVYSFLSKKCVYSWIHVHILPWLYCTTDKKKNNSNKKPIQLTFHSRIENSCYSLTTASPYGLGAWAHHLNIDHPASIESMPFETKPVTLCKFYL